jgi:hypothetical protein
MALGITKLSNQSIESAESVAAATLEWVSDTGGIVLNAGAGERFISVNLQISITFNASATLGAELHIRKSANDGATANTPEVGTFAKSIAVSAGNTVIVTHPVYDFDYLDIGIKNLDTTYTIDYTAIYEGQKMTGMD